jgi:hypothetical protein
MLFLGLNACKEPNKAEVPDKPAIDHSAHSTTKKGMFSKYGYADSVNDGLITADTLKGSPRRTAMVTINGCHIHIDYGSPGVKGRNIWGGLVAYDEVWAAGAHHATQISFNKPLKINGTTIEAGTYGFFLLPGKQEWIAIFNKNYEQHLADDYAQSEDVLRVPVTPQTHAVTQRLTYEVTALEGANGMVVFTWENLKLKIPFVVLD